jgi:hypothetical protein
MQAPQLRILLSYHYFKDVDLDAVLPLRFPDSAPQLFIDSGAYSAMTLGSEIKLDEYAAYIKRYKHWISAYANLDVIQDGAQTLDNQRRMEDLGLQPVPVFHVNTDWTYLERYIEQYKYIALGVAGMQSRTDAVMSWVARCFEMGSAQTQYHGFALTSWKLLMSFPWKSVDSSSWGSGHRFGRVPVFDSRRGRFEKIQLGDAKSCHKHAKLVRSYGFNPLDFADRTRNERAKICALSMMSYLKAERFLQRRWNTELDLYLVDANSVFANFADGLKGIREITDER